jgi:hypothetical protein
MAEPESAIIDHFVRSLIDAFVITVFVNRTVCHPSLASESEESSAIAAAATIAFFDQQSFASCPLFRQFEHFDGPTDLQSFCQWSSFPHFRHAVKLTPVFAGGLYEAATGDASADFAASPPLAVAATAAAYAAFFRSLFCFRFDPTVVVVVAAAAAF